jgi:hypothetical protein
MKYSLKSLLWSIPFLFLVNGCTDKKVELFDGKDIDNWLIFTEDSSVDPASLFWVEDHMIQTTGIPNGYLRTRDVYSNFKLHVEWRWAGEPTNSGVLLQVQGEDRIWPQAIECQLKHLNAGDLVLMGKGTGITVGDSTYLVTSEENRYKPIPKMTETSEKAPGEWNSYDITCKDGNIEVVVNGKLQNSGTGLTLHEGHILLQAEGSPIQFRNIYLEPL